MEERIGIQLAAIVPMSAWVKNGLVYAAKNARWVKIPHCRPTVRSATALVERNKMELLSEALSKVKPSEQPTSEAPLAAPKCSARPQCQCCASPLGEPIRMDGTERIICTSCLGFIARWWVELGQTSKATVSNGRHSAMKELDAWIVEQHPEDSHTLMLYADKMNDALIKLDAPNEKLSDSRPTTT